MNETPQFKPGEPLVDHQPITPRAYFDIVPARNGVEVQILYPDGAWEFVQSYLMACFAAGWHCTNPAYMPGLYDKFHKKGNK